MISSESSTAFVRPSRSSTSARTTTEIGEGDISPVDSCLRPSVPQFPLRRGGGTAGRIMDEEWWWWSTGDDYFVALKMVEVGTAQSQSSSKREILILEQL